ncbi:hypothetical protein [Kitasatospora sp. NPDC051705]|uniref:hypothetical protein n=1 Tax=Kitasatospora sp. NPDC051705 TaxID=3364057 RepID=UPI0037BA8AA9
MEPELSELAQRGAAMVVALMATDTWQQVRGRLAALLGRHRSAESVAEELDETRAEVVADPAMMSQAVVEWTARLRRLLWNRPEAAAELLALFEESAAQALPAHQPGIIVNGTFHGSVVQTGSVHVSNVGSEDRATPPGPDFGEDDEW